MKLTAFKKMSGTVHYDVIMVPPFERDTKYK